MNENSLDFEKPVIELEHKFEELRLRGGDGRAHQEELRKLQRKIKHLQRDIFKNLTPWQRTQIARHPNRPYFLDLAPLMFENFLEIHGDRACSEDPALVTLLARFEGRSVVAIGHQKGRNVKENIHRNFGMPHPEGYRKAQRAMILAEKFNKPILTFIDTPGAYPGVGAEERGQAEAIARNIYEMCRLRVPAICIVTGEGGSGGALAIGVGDRVLMLEHTIYSVISPEACAALLWRDGRSRAPEAAETLKFGAREAFEFGLIDEVVREPPGGAHRDHKLSANILRRVIRRHLRELSSLRPEELVEARYRKFRAMGRFHESASPAG